MVEIQGSASMFSKNEVLVRADVADGLILKPLPSLFWAQRLYRALNYKSAGHADERRI